MTREIIKCQNCGKAITPEEVESGISVICPACADEEDTGDCCNEEKDNSGRTSGCCC